MKNIPVEAPKKTSEPWSGFAFDATQTRGGTDVIHETHDVSGQSAILAMAGLMVRTEVVASHLQIVARRGGVDAAMAKASLLIEENRAVWYAIENELKPSQEETAYAIAAMAIEELNSSPDQPFEIWQVLDDYLASDAAEHVEPLLQHRPERLEPYDTAKDDMELTAA